MSSESSTAATAGRSAGREAAFLELVQLNPAVLAVLARIGELELPDTWLVSGCLFQTVWNVLAGEPPARCIKDYDVFYFDPADTSPETEERLNRRAAALFADTGCEVDVRNQARVHCWYEREFGVRGYPQLSSATDGIDHFLAICCMVGLKPRPSGDVDLYAPFGVDDVLDRVMRPNPWFANAPSHCYRTKAERWIAAWPALRVVPMPGAGGGEDMEERAAPGTAGRSRVRQSADAV